MPGGAIDRRVAVIEQAGGASTIAWFHADRLGSVAALTNEDGAVLVRYAYSPFGIPLTDTAGLAQPFAFTGRKYDTETGLYYYRARYYDPRLGRFLQTDPVGYADQHNL